MKKIIREYYLRILKKSLKNKKICFLVGARQVGKTTLLKQFTKNLKNYAFLSCDEIGLKNFESTTDFLNYFSVTKGVNFEKITYLILDEVQVINNISIFLKDLHDNYNFKIFASGSGSLEIFKGISDSLIGRKEILKIYPFSFFEFLQAKNTKIINCKNLTPSVIQIYENFFEEYLLFGGYPEVVMSQTKKEKIKNLLSIYQSYIEKDLREYILTKDLFAFEKFYKLISGSICSLQKIDKICKEINVHRDKIEKFSFILKNTFIIDLIPPFVEKINKEVHSHKKIYFSDIGFINSVLESFFVSADKKGKLIENFILNEIKKFISMHQLLQIFKVYFWRKKSQTEVDFVIKNLEKNKLIPIEVKSKSTDVIPKSFDSFYDFYGDRVDFFVVFNKNIFKTRKLHDKKVLFLPHFCVDGIFEERN